MTYKYSLAYPDAEELEFSHHETTKEELLKIFQDFEWDTELNKELEYYNPSIDIYNCDNQNRIIFSGFGRTKLEEFLVMFLQPKSINFKDVFDEKNYNDADSYSKTHSVETAERILRLFLEQEYNEVMRFLELDSPSSNDKDASSDELNIYAKLFLAACAPFLTLLLFSVTYMVYQMQANIDVAVIILFALSLLFLVASFKTWAHLLKN